MKPGRKPKTPLYNEEDYTFTLSKNIMIRNEFTGGIVYGVQRLGKTAYGMKVGFDIFRAECHSDVKAWDMVFDHMFFKLGDMVAFLREKIAHDKKASFCLWDDAGLHANKLVYFTDTTFAELIQNLFDVMGIATRGILLTTPVPGNLLKSLRDYEFLKIKISKANSNHARIAKAYTPNLLPSGRVYIGSLFEDRFSKLLPDDVYKRYVPIRSQYLVEALDNLDKAIEEKNLQQCIKEHELQEMRNKLEKATNA